MEQERSGLLNVAYIDWENRPMSHFEEREEIIRWEVEVCDNCGHERPDHYDRAVVSYGWIWEGCIAIDRSKDARILISDNGVQNPFTRCRCMKFV